MDINQFIIGNNIKPADAIVAKKDTSGLLDHYLIYLGSNFGEHLFIANYIKGTRILTQQEVLSYAVGFSVNRIRRFIGSEFQRTSAVRRALSRRDQSSYHLLLNNCEHLANYVQTGREFSKQTTIFGAGLTIAGIATAVAVGKNNNGGRNLGLIMAALGLLTLSLEDNNSKKTK